MSVSIVNDFISREFAHTLVDFLDPLLKETPRDGMRGALGYETSAIAAAIGYTADAVAGLRGTDREYLVEELNSLIRRTKETVEFSFNLELDLVNCSYQELTEGADNPLHSDSTQLDGSPWREDGVEEELEFSALLYLNNHGEDYLGGEIEFPLENILIEPKAGQLVFFKGDLEHIHEVKTVISGARKNLVFFFSRKGNVSDLNHFPNIK